MSFERLAQALSEPLFGKGSPSAAQIAAGNYPKGHVSIGGLRVSIETRAGQERSGVDGNGVPWTFTMVDDYGYVRGTEGRDGEQVDCFVVEDAPSDWAGPVYVIDQVQPATGSFDEHKVVLGATSADEARRVYQRNYPPGWSGLRELHEVTLDQFKSWLSDGDTTVPFTVHVSL